MTLSRTADLYMDVLYRTAVREKAETAVQKSLEGLLRHWEAFPKAQVALLSPRTPFDQKMRILEILMPKTSAHKSDLLLRFLALLWKHGRGSLLPMIGRGYATYVAQKEGHLMGEVASAVPLTTDELDRLTHALEGGLKTRVHLNARVDPALLGGLRIKAEGVVLDSTLARQLKAIEARFKGATG